MFRLLALSGAAMAASVLQLRTDDGTVSQIRLDELPPQMQRMFMGGATVSATLAAPPQQDIEHGAAVVATPMDAAPMHVVFSTLDGKTGEVPGLFYPTNLVDDVERAVQRRLGAASGVRLLRGDQEIGGDPTETLGQAAARTGGFDATLQLTAIVLGPALPPVQAAMGDNRSCEDRFPRAHKLCNCCLALSGAALTTGAVAAEVALIDWAHNYHIPMNDGAADFFVCYMACCASGVAGGTYLAAHAGVLGTAAMGAGVISACQPPGEPRARNLERVMDCWTCGHTLFCPCVWGQQR